MCNQAMVSVRDLRGWKICQATTRGSCDLLYTYILISMIKASVECWTVVSGYRAEGCPATTCPIQSASARRTYESVPLFNSRPNGLEHKVFVNLHAAMMQR